MHPHLNIEDALRSLPSQWGDDPLLYNDAVLKETGRKIVILDDDVMGTQSVYNIAVLMDWSVDALRTELESDSRAFFVVTNARTMPESQARAVNSFIVRNLCEAARQAGVELFDRQPTGFDPARTFPSRDGGNRSCLASKA